MEKKVGIAGVGRGLFFPGCALDQQTPELSDLAFAWLKQHGIADTESRACCGKPLEYRGLCEAFDKTSNTLLQRFINQGYTHVISACPNCYYTLKQFCEKIDAPIEILALPEVLLCEGVHFKQEALPTGALLTIHDSCPDRQKSVFGKALRMMLEGIPSLEMAHAKENSLCCGVGDVYYHASAEIQDAQTDRRIAEAQKLKATHILSACINCTRMFRERKAEPSAIHYLELMFYSEREKKPLMQNLS